MEHHEAVTQNAKEIMFGEKLGKKCNSSVVEVACMIHDLVDDKRGDMDEMKEVAQKLMIENGASKKFAHEVIRVVETHSFGKSQGCVEAEILYDADKLEYVSVNRFKKVLEAVNAGQMSKDKLEGYKVLWRERIVGVLPSLHFNTSRMIFNDRLEAVIQYIRTEAPEYSEWLNGVI